MSSQNVSAGIAAGKPQPQTTGQPPGGPYIRHSQPGRRTQYGPTNVAFGGMVANPLVMAPGYLRGYRCKISTTATGSGGVIAAGAGGQDFPYSTFSLVQLRDAFGTLLISGPGYEVCKIIPLISGQFGTDETQDVQQLPSWTGVTAASGLFTYQTMLPFEFTKAYGVISGANASLLPTLQWTLNPLTVGFSTPPSSPTPTVNVQVDADFYWLPEGTPMEPPGVGSTCQWLIQQCAQSVPSASSSIVQFPRPGGYLTQVAMLMRDSTSARIDGYPARPKFLVDGVQLVDSDLNTWFDDMAIRDMIGGLSVAGTQTAAGTVQTPRPTGLLTLNRKTGLAQRHFGLLDTGEEFLSTQPGTQLELNGSPWATISNSPAVVNVLMGQIVASGALIQGLPEI